MKGYSLVYNNYYSKIYIGRYAKKWLKTSTVSRAQFCAEG